MGMVREAAPPCETRVDEQGKELLEHGSISFPVGYYYDDLQRWPVQWHWHEELELAVVTEGRTVVAVDSHRYEIEAGGGFFVNAGVLHGCRNLGDGTCRFHSLVFHPRLVCGSLDSVFWHKYVQPVVENASLKGICFDPANPWHREVLDRTEAAWQSCAKGGAGYEFLVREQLSGAVFQISEHTESGVGILSEKSQRDELRIKQMLQYIHSHFAEEISLGQIAGSAMISESECLRCFRSTIGTTPIRYLKVYRLQQAEKLLRTTQEKIVDIGVQCGFQDMSYFAKAFRSSWGCAPAQYRARRQERNESVSPTTETGR